MAAIAGKYKFNKNEKLSEFMTSFGLPKEFIAKGEAAKPTMEFIVDGDNISIISDYEVKKTTLAFKLGAEFEDPLPHGEILKSVATMEGNKLIIKSKRNGTDDAGSRVYEFNATEVVCTMTAKSTPVVAKRYFSRI